MLQCTDYLRETPGPCQDLIETLLQTFFDDFGSVRHTLHDTHFFLGSLLDRLSPADEARRAALLSSLYSAVARRREVEDYTKELFAGVRLEADPADTQFAGPVAPVVAAAWKIWDNLQRCAEFMPLTMRYLIKMVVESWETKLGKKLEDGFVRKVVGEFLVEKMLTPTLQRPFENELVDDCAVGEANLACRRLIEIVHAFWLGREYPPGHPLVSANGFIKATQLDE